MNDTLRPQGALTLDTVAGQIDAVSGVMKVNLSAISEVDSSAVALLLAWQRKAYAAGTTLQLSGAPESLRRLIAVYGLTTLLPLAD